MVRISAFGQTGPVPRAARLRAHRRRRWAALSYLSGYPDRPPVTPGTPTIPDYLAGALGAFGALVALEHRHRTGEGQVVDVGALRAHAADAGRADPRLRRHRLRARAHRLGHRVRRAAQPLPGARRALDGHRLHQRPDVRAPGRAPWAGRSCAARVPDDGRAAARGAPSSTRSCRRWVGRGRRAPRSLARLDARRGAVLARGQRARSVRGPAHAGAREHRRRCRARSAACSRWSGIVRRLTRDARAASRAPGPVAVGAHNEEIYCGRLGLSRDDLPRSPRAASSDPAVRYPARVSVPLTEASLHYTLEGHRARPSSSSTGSARRRPTGPSNARCSRRAIASSPWICLATADRHCRPGS